MTLYGGQAPPLHIDLGKRRIRRLGDKTASSPSNLVPHTMHNCMPSERDALGSALNAGTRTHPSQSSAISWDSCETLYGRAPLGRARRARRDRNALPTGDCIVHCCRRLRPAPALRGHNADMPAQPKDMGESTGHSELVLVAADGATVKELQVVAQAARLRARREHAVRVRFAMALSCPRLAVF